MKIVGCDLHTRYQQIAMLDQETGELIERRRVAQPFAFFAKAGDVHHPASGEESVVEIESWWTAKRREALGVHPKVRRVS